MSTSTADVATITLAPDLVSLTWRPTQGVTLTALEARSRFICFSMNLLAG